MLRNYPNYKICAKKSTNPNSTFRLLTFDLSTGIGPVHIA